MCLCFISLFWRSAFVTHQNRQNVGKFDIKYSILTKKGSNLALFWSELYKHIILQCFFYKFDEFVLIETNAVINIDSFFDNLKIMVLEIAFGVQILLLSRFSGKNRKIPLFLYVVGTVCFSVVMRLCRNIVNENRPYACNCGQSTLGKNFFRSVVVELWTCAFATVLCRMFFLDGSGMHVRIL